MALSGTPSKLKRAWNYFSSERADGQALGRDTIPVVCNCQYTEIRAPIRAILALFRVSSFSCATSVCVFQIIAADDLLILGTRLSACSSVTALSLTI